MRYIKQFEAKKKSSPDIDFLMKEVTNAIKDKMDEICGKFTTWELRDEDAGTEEFVFDLYVSSYEDEEYVDKNEVFYRILVVDYSNLHSVIQEQVLPLLENNGVFGYISTIQYEGYISFECEFGSMFTRGKNTGLLDQIV